MTDKQNTNATETATDANNGTNEAGNKTFTQQDMDNLAGKIRSEEKAKYDKITKDAIAAAIAEHERQAKLTQDERDKEARKKREQELENRDLEITMRERSIEKREIFSFNSYGNFPYEFEIVIIREKPKLYL